MGLFDGVGSLKKIPQQEFTGEKRDVELGVHKAQVGKPYVSEEEGYINIPYRIAKFNNSAYHRYYPGRSKASDMWIAGQLSKLGFTVQDGPSMKRAFDSMEGLMVVVEVKQAKNPKYKDVLLVGLDKQEEEDPFAEEANPDEIPF